MHYPDEPYVRKYTRKTLTWHKLGWEGRAVKDAMLDEFDRAGIFETMGDAAECIALVTGIPLEHVRIGIERLLATKTWTLTEGALVWPNYVEAQTCARSDKVRQAESRVRRAEEAVHHEPSRPVTSRHEPSRGITPGHEPSQNVTPSLAYPNLTDLSLAPEAPASAQRAGNLEDDPEPEPLTRPRSRRGRRGKPPSWWQFPKGWQWSPETAAAAAAKGITDAELRDHVQYWTIHMWPVEVTDLDGELVRAFDGIKSRRSKAGGEGDRAPPASNPYAWAPTSEHRAFAAEKGLPLKIAVDAYRASGRPEKLGTIQANEDFMRRLRHYAASGEFVPTGPLPKVRSADAARGAA